MNLTTILGILIGFTIVISTVWLTADDVYTFLNLPGFLIVMGGTIAATIVSYPPRYVWRVWSNFMSAMKNERVYEKRDVDEIVDIVKIWRKGQVQKVEERINLIQSPFLQTGLRLILDNTPAEDVLELLQWRIARLRAKEFAEADVFRTMGTYAPAFGMVGTLIGLVNMLFNLNTENLDQIGINMALALITTFYGLILGNLLFKPIASKLEDRTERRIRTLGMALEAVILVSRRRSPIYIRETLYSFLTKYDDEVFNAKEQGRKDGYG